MSEKHVYFFGGNKSEGRSDMKELLGGKGANLAEMDNLGIPVPPGFTITTDVCTYFQKHDGKYPDGLKKQVEEKLKLMEKILGAKFDDKSNPLLVSVRSGARASMPGMMDTILNLGLNDEAVKGLIAKTNNERFGYDSYRRFIQMYSNVVMKMDSEHLEHILENLKKEKGVSLDTELTSDDLKGLIPVYKKKVKELTGQDFPEKPIDQLWGAINAVFSSWDNPRAKIYRKMNRIPDEWGTAVNVQTMVFGNMGDTSGTGVAFTRDPATGEKKFYGEFLMNAQGEDVVAGIRTPKAISELKDIMSDSYNELVDITQKLEQHYKDMQDIEFTIQEGKLWMLQTRVAKRTGLASVNIAVDMVEEGLIDDKTAIMRVEPEKLNELLQPVFDLDEKREAEKQGNLLAKGLNAGPGAASGKIAFTSDDAEKMFEDGKDVVLVRIETSPEDIGGMKASKGILTARGGMTSHAALVARQMGKVCVAGCGELEINYKDKSMKVGNITMKEGDDISIDGTTGEVFKGAIKTIPSETLQVLLEKKLDPKDSDNYQKYAKIMEWADKYRRLNIRTNADTPAQCEKAIAFGAEGIGLCRTEHMFFEGDRIKAVREMILSSSKEGREKALAKILPYQKEDFTGIFEVMDGRPCTIRLLDPPLHEFLPHTDKEVSELAKDMGVSKEELHAIAEKLHEFNPMLGHRGCRLGIVYPEISEMQARAIMEAACDVKKKGQKVNPEIMIPLVGHINEFKAQEEVIRRICEDVIKESGVKVDYLVGTMIELPRAALTANEIAEGAEFFSFGTNDLTQTTFGLSRDDSGRFLPFYVNNKILEVDPFVEVDRNGVGELMKIGVRKGRETRKGLKVGICGEHGGNPSSVEFCHMIDMDYVSCSPFRVPIARLAAAQASVTN